MTESGTNSAGSPEGQAGINSPGLIERIESKAGGEGHDRDGGEVDADGPHAEDLQQHHDDCRYWWPDRRARNTSAAPGLKPLSANAAAIGVDDDAQV